MEKRIAIKQEYLSIPIKVGERNKLFEIFIEKEDEKEKLFEFQIPIGETGKNDYVGDYDVYLPVKQFIGQTLMLQGDMQEEFLTAIRNVSNQKHQEESLRPLLHFTPETGWMNDPNGLVYKDGVYHLYFQYNPFHIQWENMSWGHAVSTDLLHWEQKDTVLFPDETGTMFSGSGIVNEKGMLGLPQEALLFFYTAAGSSNIWSKGKDFGQYMAYSLDGGKTLVKTKKEVLTSVCKENRDPKVFWHEESKAYIMVLWLEKNDFGIFRSIDLENWNQTDKITLEQGFECPDLLKLFDQDGKEHWVFWSADGYYYWGEFDGYQFKTTGERQKAYMNEIPYAAQTYSGTVGRTIQIPWLRIPNTGKKYTGAMGLPRELSVLCREEERLLRQKPIREIEEWKKSHAHMVSEYMDENMQVSVICTDDKKFSVDKSNACKGKYCWKIDKLNVAYDMEKGFFTVGNKTLIIPQNIRDFLFIVDDDIFEVTADCDTIVGVFLLADPD